MPMLTVAAVRKYAAQTKPREIRDSGAPGLYLVVQAKPSGTKSWAMRFRRPDGRPAKLTLGRVDLQLQDKSEPMPTSPSEPVLGGALTLWAARQLANKIHNDRATGRDVIAEHAARKHGALAAAAQRNASGFGIAVREFFSDYKVKRWGARPRRWREDARLLGLHYPPDCDPATTEPEVIKGSLAHTWASKPVAEITDDDVYAVVDAARRHGIPGLPRRNKEASDARGRKMHGALSVLFRWLLRHRKVRSNPCVAVERPGPPPQRERALSDSEVRWLWRACDKLGTPYGPLLQVLLLTGARLGEVTGMRHDELAEGEWTVPAARAKNHRPNLLPLPAFTLAIVTGALRIAGADLVFTRTGKLLTGFSRVKHDLDAAMLAAAREEDPTATVPPWRLHDLRRTASTGMHDALGVAPHVVEAVLSHVSGHKAGVAGVYNKAEYRAEKAEALRRWAQHVAGVVSGEPEAKVVALRARKPRSRS
jgi:integrase